MVDPPQPAPRKSRARRLTVIGIAALVAAAAVTGVAVAAGKSGRYTVTGKVMCYNQAGTVGIWVESEKGGSGFATLHEVNIADGWGWTRFTAEIANGGSYRLNVGCGGNPRDWAMTAHSDTYTASELDLICNDVPPWLQALGDRFFPVIKLGFDTEVQYGRCKAVKQVNRLQPKPMLTTIAPLPPPAAATPTAIQPIPQTTQAPPVATTRDTDFACTQSVIGTVCVRKTNNGYDASFDNASADSLVDFNLQTDEGTYGDNGAFWSAPGQKNSYFFAVGYKSWARVCLYSRDYKFSPICTPTV